MDVNVLRNWGIAASAAALAVALALATMGHASPGEAPGASSDRLVAQDITSDGAFETAQAGPPPPVHAGPLGRVAFLVRFRGTGPLANAQALAARGRMAQAGAAAQAALRSQSAFAGLCFDHYTVGGAETVLRSCAVIPAAERAAFQARWTARLQGMRAVAYVDANADVSQERRP
jgi:hypothetical protein